MVGHRNYDCSIWEAVRATSAAPLFFEPLTLEASRATFVDGAVRANNPVEQVTSEARRLWPDRSIGCLVSLGTGVTLPQGFNPNKSRLHEILQSLADIATDANTKAREFRDTREGRELIRSRKYFRYSVPQGMGEVDLADFERIPYMESITLPYAVEMDHDIEECARNLVHPSSPR
jgi:predicted acylesterase/phospholipase RssA